jgi:hypothetical protein
MRVQLRDGFEETGHELLEGLKEGVDVLLELRDERLDQRRLLAPELLQREQDVLRKRVAMSKSQARKNEARTYTPTISETRFAISRFSAALMLVASRPS